MDCRAFILSEEVRDILIDYSFQTEEIRLKEEQYCRIEIDGELGVLYIPASYEDELRQSQYKYAYTPKCFGLTQLDENDSSYEVSGIYQIQNRPLGLTGKQVLLGFVDTGIRPGLPVFQNEDGSSRIFAIWDQTDQSGTAPEGFFYGSEYRLVDGRIRKVGPIGEKHPASQNADAIADTEVSDESGHGTAAASVAIQAAYDAQIVMVKCKQAKRYLKEYYAIAQNKEAYAESDIINGIAYLERVSRQTNRPLVICFTMGTNMGSHFSDSILDQFLVTLSKRRGHGIVLSGGNEGNSAHHYEGAITRKDGSAYEDVEIRVSDGVTGFSFELWGNSPSVFTISLRSPDGEVLQRIPLSLGQEQTYSFVYSDTVATVGYLSSERTSAKQLIFVRMRAPLAGIWTMRVYAEQGTGQAVFGIWLPIDAFLNQPVYFLRPDPFTTLTEPAYIDNGIALSYYDAKNSSFAAQSGRGFVTQTDTYPTLCAPGISVMTALGPKSGGSISAALTAGAVAQFLEWAVVRGQDRLVNSRGIRNYFIRGAVREPMLEYPNPTWGYGKMNIAGVFDALITDRF